MENRRVVYIEFLGAYDGWMAFEDQETLERFHRIDNSRIIESIQPVEYGAIYFKTESGFFRNLRKITKEEYELQTLKG